MSAFNPKQTLVSTRSEARHKPSGILPSVLHEPGEMQMPTDPPQHPVDSHDGDSAESAQDDMRQAGHSDEIGAKRNEIPADGKNLYGIQGWLTTYHVYLLIAAGLCFLEAAEIFFSRTGAFWLSAAAYFDRGPGFWLLLVAIKFGLYAFAANSLKRIGTPWVRNFHIALNGVSVIAVLTTVIGWPTVLTALVLVPWSQAFPHSPYNLFYEYIFLIPLIGPLFSLFRLAIPAAWTAYWARSGRIRNIYAAHESRRGAGSQRDDYVLDVKRSSSRAWLFATLFGGLFALLPWASKVLGIFLGVAGIFSVSFLFILSYPLILVIFAVISWRLHKSGKYRVAGVISVIPIGLVIAFSLLGPAYYWAQDMPRETAQSYKENRRDSLETTFYANGQRKSEGNYDNGRQDGLWVQWYEDGQKQSEGNYVYGRQEGLWMRWHANGQKQSEANYVNGRKIGLATNWYENGQKRMEIPNHVDGMIDGLVTEWYESGAIKSEENNVAGRTDGLQIKYYENGQKEVEGNYVNRRQDGLWTWWYETGQKSSELNFVSGACDGRDTRWYKNGQKKRESIPLDEQCNRLVTEWYENGQKKN